jgi:hypothetical protein
MRKLMWTLTLLLCVVAGPPAYAEIGTADAVPAATLLLPYFEVDLANPNGVVTLFSINNASSSAALAHVTLWTDWGIPTFAFQVYLTGYDVQTINMRDIFNGVLPRTADSGIDPDAAGPSPLAISNRGQLSEDINFGGNVGPCGDFSTVYGQPDPTLPDKIAHIRQAHTGHASAIFGGRCSGATYGDQIARGYVTVDTVNSCSLLFPNSPGYFTSIATHQNILWGDVIYVNGGENFAQGDTLVHIEACNPGGGYTGFVGNGAGHCPFVTGDYTFYGRYASVAGLDQREPLATTFATRYVNGGAFSGGTNLLVWRDTKTNPGPPGSANGPRTCGTFPSWFPLAQTDVVSFDEQENPTDQCFLEDNVAPPIGGVQTCFPLATQRIETGGGNIVAEDMNIPTPFGWLYLNLNYTLTGDPFPGKAQAWVTTIMDASGRFSVGYPAIQLDNAITSVPGGRILIP